MNVVHLLKYIKASNCGIVMRIFEICNKQDDKLAQIQCKKLTNWSWIVLLSRSRDRSISIPLVCVLKCIPHVVILVF